MAILSGAIPESLMESELFGYEPGAFTGAVKGGKPGLFELSVGERMTLCTRLYGAFYLYCHLGRGKIAALGSVPKSVCHAESDCQRVRNCPK